jgi:class 3 adenylate cyclase
MESVQVESLHSECAVVFVDISGSTRLYEALGDEPALDRVAQVLAILQDVTRESGGRVVKGVGDGLMCAFAVAETALGAARIMQERIESQRAMGNLDLGIHVGCHYGPVIENTGDLYGDTVNVAARVAGLARVAEILTTEDTVGRLSSTAREHTRLLDRVPVKGKQAALPIYEVLWQEGEDLTMLGTRFGTERATRLVLRHDGRDITMDEGGPASVTFGRDAGCEIVIADRRASRLHAHIERRRDKFVLVDHSANGTWVGMAGSEEVVLRREEQILGGQGVIGIGQSPRNEGAARIEFECR